MDIEGKLQSIETFRKIHGENFFDYLALLELQKEGMDVQLPDNGSWSHAFSTYQKDMKDTLELLWNHPHRFHELTWTYQDEAIDKKHSIRRIIFAGELSYIPLRLHHEDCIFTTPMMLTSELPELQHSMTAVEFSDMVLTFFIRWGYQS